MPGAAAGMRSGRVEPWCLAVLWPCTDLCEVRCRAGGACRETGIRKIIVVKKGVGV